MFNATLYSMILVSALLQPSEPTREAANPGQPALMNPVPFGPAPLSQRPDGWRFVKHNNRWWYWLPSEKWVVWNEVTWVAPADAPPPYWNPLFYVPEFDRPYAGMVILTPTGYRVIGGGAGCIPRS